MNNKYVPWLVTCDFTLRSVDNSCDFHYVASEVFQIFYMVQWQPVCSRPALTPTTVTSSTVGFSLSYCCWADIGGAEGGHVGKVDQVCCQNNHFVPLVTGYFVSEHDSNLAEISVISNTAERGLQELCPPSSQL